MGEGGNRKGYYMVGNGKRKGTRENHSRWTAWNSYLLNQVAIFRSFILIFDILFAQNVAHITMVTMHTVELLYRMLSFLATKVHQFPSKIISE